jgi:hypothetical protein
MIITANPATLVDLARLADQERDSLIRDIHDGTLSDRFDVPAEVREALKRRLSKRHRARAGELEQVAERTGAFLPRDFWPKMTVLAVWTGGSVGAYLPKLREYYGEGTVFRDHGLHASEGRMTIPLHDNSGAGVVDFLHTYFEFIPEAEHGRPDASVLEAHELVEGQTYFIVLTTSGGLYRYDIHDLVRCVGHEGEAPVLEFLNKGSSFSSINGEKLSEFQAVTAVRKAFEQLRLPVELFTLAPQFGDPPGYVLLVESRVAEGTARALVAQIDASLAGLNCEYAERLRNGRLRPLTLKQVPPNTWNALRDGRVSRLGGSMEQYKHPCLVNDLGFIEQILPESAPSSRAG